MPLKVILLGREQKHFTFVQSALRGGDYRFRFISLQNAENELLQIADANLVILDTVSLAEPEFSNFYFLREGAQFAHIPILALVKPQPPRLRYRLIDMGINDYVPVPPDPLDIQVRVRNLIEANSLKLLGKGDVSTSTQLQPSVVAMQTLTSVYQNMNKAIVDLNRDGLVRHVLRSLRNLCQAKLVMLFDLEQNDRLALHSASTERSDPDAGLNLMIDEEPLLVKAVRLRQPTVLNRISTDNALVAHLNERFNIRATSIVLFPVVAEKRTRSLLMLLKTGEEVFSDLHFLLIQNLSYFIAQSNYLDSLRSDLQEKLDERIWKYYYDFLSQIINQLDFGILIIGAERRIKFVNRHAASLLRVDRKQVLHQPITAILDEEMVDNILGSFQEASPLSVERPELELEAPDGKKMLIGFSVSAFNDQVNREQGFLVLMKDITYTREIQEEMRRVDRLASLGVMASGIAHEIRNPLAGIKAMAQTFEEELDPEDSKSEYVQRIIRLVNRLDDLLRTLFSYAKPPKPNRESCDLDNVLSDVMSLLRQKIRDQNIEVSRSIHPRLPSVYVDPSQIQQVLMNLLLNSIEAISSRGAISISIQPYKVTEAVSKSNEANYLALIKPGNYIRILIEDDGCGISQENLNYIYNPFFTTKTFGTGLGLSIVYQIVKENDGVIYYESEADQGTSCFLFFPVDQVHSADGRGGER